MEDESLHILMVPWLAFGHLLPFLNLSKSLAQKGHQISFLTTPKNAKRLPTIPSSLTHLIQFIQFPLPQIDHLPRNAEATIDLPSDNLRPLLRKAFDTFNHKLSNLIQNKQISSLDIIIYDYAAYWVPPIAAKFGVPCAFLALHNAAALSFFGPTSALMGGASARTKAEEFTELPNWIPFKSTIFYRPFEARELFEPGVLPDASGVSESYRYGKSIRGCQVVLIRSCIELEPEWLKLLAQLYGKPVVPVGLLPPTSVEVEHEEWQTAVDWLDDQEVGSVVYVAFGSEVKLSDAQAREIADGLILSELPFLWALRSGSVSVGGGGSGLVCVGWVPQLRILAHPSVGGFLTHGGWSSIVEGLGFGRVIVVLPMMFEQGLNARNLVEKGLGVEVPRKEEDGSFSAYGIADSLKLAMGDHNEGDVLRAKVKDCKNVFGNQEMHDLYVTELVQHIRDINVHAG